MDDEQIIYGAKKHWVIFVWPLVMLWAGMFMWLQNESFTNPGVPFLILSVALFYICYRWRRNACLLVTNKRIFITRGIFDVKAHEIPLEQVEDVKTKQNVTGFFMRYGDLYFRGEDDKEASIVGITHPRAVKHEIERIIADTRS